MAPARIHPGRLIHDWDHLVITLREGAGSGPETALLSLYAITYSASLGAGHVALLEVPSTSAAGRAVTLADDDALGRRMQARLRSMGLDRAALAGEPVAASFEREPFERDAFGFRIVSDGLEVHARWEEAWPPFWVDGQGGGFSDNEDIWAMMVGARRASLTVNGIAAPGDSFDDDAWVAKLGRSLSSAHAAFAEVRVEPVSGQPLSPSARRSVSGG
ncbi:MAG TPA: hypothetical protein VGQ58_08475 [Candidatus Limnocylindrales bacterium]|jgi:hypothetical protein|nr:hypothetical protein [Candidatus Limnocylindrales bacterium]